MSFFPASSLTCGSVPGVFRIVGKKLQVIMYYFCQTALFMCGNIGTSVCLETSWSFACLYSYSSWVLFWWSRGIWSQWFSIAMHLPGSCIWRQLGFFCKFHFFYFFPFHWGFFCLVLRVASCAWDAPLPLPLFRGMLPLHPHLLTLLADETHLHFPNSLPKLFSCLSFHFFSTPSSGPITGVPQQ